MNRNLLLLVAWTAAEALAQERLGGVVQDASGQAVPKATVEVRNAGGAVLFETATDAQGWFEWSPAPAGSFHIRVSAKDFAVRDTAVRLYTEDRQVNITLQPEPVYSQVTVMATRGAVEEEAESAHLSIVKDNAEIRQRPLATIGNALEAEPGILVQQSTYAQVSPFLRGLTGYQILNLVDGIRFNNSTFRSGPNQYLSFVDPMQAQRVEAILGPAGVQYGSDALGGALHVATAQPRFASQSGWETHGDVHLGAASADLSGFGGGRVSLSNQRLFWLLGGSGRRHNDLRAGQGYDSRNVYHKLFGMPFEDVKQLLGSRQQDSGFRQYGVESKFALRLSPYQILTVNYQRGVQDMVRAYKDLLGGLGRLQSTFEPQVLDWLYVRHEKAGLGPLDSLSGTFSWNSQTDGGRRQNLLVTDPVTTDLARVKVYGYSGQATTHWTSRMFASFGGDAYDERVSSSREVFNPRAGNVSRPRPLYPNGSQYQNLGLFGQASFSPVQSLHASAGVRFTGVRFATQEDRTFGIPNSSQWFRDITYHGSLRWQITGAFGVHGVVSRGFRAPNLNDLGALGLNDLGYEVPASDAIPAGALLSTDASEGAVSKRQVLGPLKPESLKNYEAGISMTLRRLYSRVQVFNAELYDPIVRRTLLFPAASPPTQLAGLPVSVLPQTSAQQAQGVVTVATALDPRAVKTFANDGRARYYGVEMLARYLILRRLSLDTNYSYLVGRELNPNRNARRLPPQMGAATLRYTPSGARPWIEVSLMAAGAQDRLSGGDSDDERIGASFRRADIAAFFRGSRVGGVGDLLAIQNRVLPIGAVINGTRVIDDNTRVPLYLSTSGWTTISLRSGIPLGERWQAVAALENLLDRNYRIHGSGLDSPGINAYLGLSYRF